jgi:hypothetical protein
MLSGVDSAGFDIMNVGNCNNGTAETGVLIYKHDTSTMALHHEKTTECWRETQPRGRVDYFHGAFCIPDLTDRQWPNEEQLSMRQAEMRGCANTPTGADNVALNKPATQSSLYDHGTTTFSNAAGAVDGNTDGKTNSI